jgi:hypothetical protein
LLHNDLLPFATGVQSLIRRPTTNGTVNNFWPAGPFFAAAKKVKASLKAMQILKALGLHF